MSHIKNEIHEAFLNKNGFYRDLNNYYFNCEGNCFTLLPDKGKGHYWFYSYKNIFLISVLDFVLYEDLFIEYPNGNYLSLSYYESISGAEFEPYYKFAAPCLKGHFCHNNPYKCIFHKNIPVRCISLIVTPEYCKEYIHAKNSQQYKNLAKAFSNLDSVPDFPELIYLLNQIKNCRFSGISAKLYYESKVMEAISMIVQKINATASSSSAKRVAPQDFESLVSVTKYIDKHFPLEIKLDALSKIACMGTTKLKYTFKAVYNCTISDYILNKRLKKAEYLLSSTDLSISQISQSIGYKKAGSFSEIFRKNTGLLPNEYRKLSSYNGYSPYKPLDELNFQ